MAENKIEIKIVIDSKQAQAGVANVQSALGKMSDSAKPAKSGVDAVNSALNNTKSVQAPSTFSAVSASVDTLRTRTTLLNSAMSTVPSTVAPAVLNLSTLNNTIASAKPASANITGLASALDTVRTSAATAGTSLGSAFKVQLPTEQINNIAASMGGIELGTRTASSGIGKVAGSFTSLATKAGIAGAVIYSVMKTITMGFQAIRDGAAATDVDRVFAIQAQKMGDTSDAILARIKASTQNTITDLQAKQLANQAGIANMSVENVTTTVAYLREYANATGKSFEQLMTTIFTGLSRGSTLMLDDAGILIDQTDLVAQKERELGRELSALGQKKVIVAEAMRQMSENMDQFGDRTQSATTKLDRLTTKLANWLNKSKQDLASSVNDALVLNFGGTLDEQIKAMENRIAKYKKNNPDWFKGMLSGIGLSPVEGWQKELNALKTTAAELKRNSSLYNKATSGSGGNTPGEIEFKPEDFATGDDKSKSDPLSSIKSELEQITGEQWRVQVAIDTVGSDELTKRIEEENTSYRIEAARLENDRTKENSTLTDKALRDLNTVHNLKIKLIRLEDEEQKRKEQERHQERIDNALDEFKLDVDSSAADRKLDEFDRKIEDLKRKLQGILKMEDITPEQAVQAQKEYDRGVSAINQDRWQQNQNTQSKQSLDTFINSNPSFTEYEGGMMKLDNQLDLGEITESAYEYQKAMLDLAAANGEVEKGIGSLGNALTNTDIKGAFDAMESSATGFLTTFAQTGAIDINGLANGLLESLQAYSAQKVAHLTMEYIYNQVMSIVDPTNQQYAIAAAAAASAIPVFAGIVAGSGLAGMAHDGISAIPEDGTWLLQKNERIVGAELNRDLTTFLSSQTSNIATGGGFSVNLGGITMYADDADSVKRVTPRLYNEIEERILSSARIKRKFGVR